MEHEISDENKKRLLKKSSRITKSLRELKRGAFEWTREPRASDLLPYFFVFATFCTTRYGSCDPACTATRTIVMRIQQQNMPPKNRKAFRS